MAKRKLNSSLARPRKRTKLDGPQNTAPGSQAGRTRRVERSSPPPPRSSSPAKSDAGQHEGRKRKRPDDSNQDSSGEPAAKRARASQSRAADGEESRSKSPRSDGLWPLIEYDPNHSPSPDRTNSLGYLTHLSIMNTVRALAEEPPSPELRPIRNFGPASGEVFRLESDSDEPREMHRPQSPRRPRGPLTSPSPSPPPGLQPALPQPALQQYSRSSSSERTDVLDEETMTAWAANSAGASLFPRHQHSTLPESTRQSTPSPVPSPAERRPMATNRVSRRRGRSGRRSATPPTAGQNPPLHRQPPKKKAKKAKKEGKTQDQECPSPALVDDFVTSKRSTRRDKGVTLWCLGDNGAARQVVSKR